MIADQNFYGIYLIFFFILRPKVKIAPTIQHCIKELKNKFKELIIQHLVCDLPNKSNLYIVKLHIVQNYMDIGTTKFWHTLLRQVFVDFKGKWKENENIAALKKNAEENPKQIWPQCGSQKAFQAWQKQAACVGP